jgi:simple sugar transport system ATP-binding protein
VNAAGLTAAHGDAIVCERVDKSFGPVRALDGAELRVQCGRIAALLGENGAGKSTLVRVIAGELSPDAGRVQVNGSVGIVRQQLSIVPELTVLENLAFGAETAAGQPGRWGRLVGRVDWRALRDRASALAERTHLHVPLERNAGELPPGVQQRAELLGALLRGARVLLLDEPTSYLTPHEVDMLFAVIRGLVADGVSTVFISHKLREVADHCDEVTVLRKGRTVARFDGRPFDLTAIGRSMTGERSKASNNGAQKRAAVPATTQAATGRERLLSAAQGALWVEAGEIIGVAGVAGNGQDELFFTLAGLARDPRFTPIELRGDDVTLIRTWERRMRGLRLIPADLRSAGIVASASVTDNVVTAMVRDELRGRLGRLRRGAATDDAGSLIADSRIVATGPSQLAGELSGGNQQRLMVARELRGEATVVIAHEPTRGADFSAAAAIDERLRAFAAAGGAVLLITSDLDELLALSNRVHVLRDGVLSRSLARGRLSHGRLGELLGGLDADEDDNEIALRGRWP